MFELPNNLTPAVSVTSYDSWEDAQADMAEREERAASALHPHQLTATYGSSWMWQHDDLLVFGRVHTLDEVPGDERAMTREMEQRHYLFGRAWSVACVEGELGDTHRAKMWPISELALAEARAHDWTFIDASVQPHLADALRDFASAGGRRRY